MIYGLKALELIELLEISLEIEVNENLLNILTEDAVSRDFKIRKKGTKTNLKVYVGNTEAASRNGGYGSETKGQHAGRIKIKEGYNSYVVRLSRENNTDKIIINYGVKDTLTPDEKEFFRSSKGKCVKEFVKDNAKYLVDIYYMDNEQQVIDNINKISDSGKYEFLDSKGKKIERIK